MIKFCSVLLSGSPGVWDGILRWCVLLPRHIIVSYQGAAVVRMRYIVISICRTAQVERSPEEMAVTMEDVTHDDIVGSVVECKYDDYRTGTMSFCPYVVS